MRPTTRSIPESQPDVQSTGLRTSRLGDADLPALTDLCARCAPFFAMVHGAADAERDASDMLASLPPGSTTRDKHLFGFWRDTSLIAAMNFAQDFPAPRVWYVAGFVVSPGARGLGIGTRLWSGAEAWLRAQEATRVELIVQQENPAAKRFWEARGFTVTGEAAQRLGERENQVWRMARQLTPAKSVHR